MDETNDLLLGLGVPEEKIIKKGVKLHADEGEIFINDYKYYPRHRESLRKSKIGQIIDEWFINNKNKSLNLAEKFCSSKKHFEKISFDSSSDTAPNWHNNFVSIFDAVSLYGFLAVRNPRYYVEVGSGNTTMFAAQSICDNNLRTKIISIDPFPRRHINELCHKIFRIPFEDMDLEFFDTLTAEDVLVIDNSHRSFPNSDVTVFFTEVLPRLPAGMLYTMHDILLPYDYSEIWSNRQYRWYNEQYLLCSYILGGAGGDKIVYPAKYLTTQDDIFKTFSSLWGPQEMFDGERFKGSFFWMEKGM